MARLPKADAARQLGMARPTLYQPVALVSHQYRCARPCRLHQLGTSVMRDGHPQGWLLLFLPTAPLSRSVSYVDNDVNYSTTLHKSGAWKRRKVCRHDSTPCPSTG